jgi:hypothetical protein
MKPHKKQSHSKIARKLLAIGLFCLLFLPLNGFAKTLAEYRAGLQAAAKNTGELRQYVDGVLAKGETDAAYERETLSQIRESLPGTERVEWERFSIETGNQWLEARLKAF